MPRAWGFLLGVVGGRKRAFAAEEKKKSSVVGGWGVRGSVGFLKGCRCLFDFVGVEVGEEGGW